MASSLGSASIPVENSNLAAANSLSELAQSVKEKGLWIFGESDSKRRVITIEKRDGSYGFTLQSYGVRYKHGNRETDFITYVNAVEKDGAAYQAGLREGDVILSINGHNMARVEHSSLVSFIRKCPTHLKMLVISDERARKVELHMRYVHLQKKLQDKMQELEKLNKAEKEILLGTFDACNGIDFQGSSCLGDVTSACCFCPTKTLFLDDKEKSKSMGSKSKKQDAHYDCYRKSQSTKELNSNSVPSSSNPAGVGGSVVGIQAAKAQSGGELSTLTSSSSGGFPTSGPPTSSGHSSHCQDRHVNAHTHQKSSICGRDSATPTPSTSSKPKSWDNLMATKSFGGYGFGFGYGYYPSKGGGHHHFSHPHHHNHHTHCGSHAHAGYYYNGGKPKVSQQGSSSRRSSVDSSSYADSTRQFSNYTTYKMVGTTRVVARVTMGNIEGPAAGACIRTLPSARSSSSSRQTPDTSSFTSKLEKTLSDSSLNSEYHRDFPKSMSYFSRSSENEGQYSSDDDYEEYATEKNLGPKNDIFV